MTFDVGELPGRAQDLKKKGIEAATRALEQGDMTGQMYSYSAKQAEQAFAGVENIYDDFVGCPAPEDFVSTCTSLEAVMGKLAIQGIDTDPVGGASAYVPANTDLAGVATSGGYMADWTGDAASAYQTNFASKFLPVTSNQYVLASVVRQAVNAEAAIWQGVRDDLDKLSKDAIDKMDEVFDKSPSDWNAILSVAAAVVGVAAVPLTGGTSLELTFAAVGAGLSVAATGISAAEGGTKDELGLESGNPWKILESLQEALGKVRTHITEMENKVWDAMNSTCGHVDGAWDRVRLPRPAISHAKEHRFDDAHFLGQSNG